MAMTQTQKTDAYQFFIVAFGAVTGVEYMNQLDDAYGAGMTTKQIVNVYTTKPQFTSQYPTFLTNEQFAQKLIANVVGTSASAQALAAAEADVVGALNAGWSRGDVIFQIFSNLAAKPHDDAEWGNTAKMFANKVAVAQYLTEVKMVNTEDLGVLSGYLANVTADSDTSTPGAIEQLFGKDSVELTLGKDTIVATQEGLTFTAGLAQAGMLGNVSNTLESGDSIIAKGEGNTLKADLITTVTGGIPVGPAISATTKNIQVVELRAQTPNTDIAGVHPNFSHIDAENMAGVKEWWTVNSRSDIQIEDVRTRPEDTLIGMRDTDPEVGFRVYFDPEQLKNGTTVKNSALTLTLDKVSAPGDLSNNVFNGVKFTLDGKSITLQSAEIGAATTHAELLAALEAAAAGNADLAGVTFTLNANNTITMTDPAGKEFGTGSWLTPTGDIPPVGDFKWAQAVGEPDRGTELISTQVELDNVGRTSAGGELDIGSLGNGGVEKFNVVVDRDSWLSNMHSSDHLGQGGFDFEDGQNEYLQEVHLTSKGANGNLKLGSTVANRLDGRLAGGLEDVRVVDGSAFKGNLNIGLTLTVDALGRYLDNATGEVPFNYTGGQGNDIFNINVNGLVSEDPDFAMNVNMGAGDDRLILGGATRLNSTSVDGGTGNNTFVTSTSVGTTAANSFESFTNFQNYEVEGVTATEHDFTDLNGVQNVTVATGASAAAGATGPAVDTLLRNLPADISTVSLNGKNQTIGNANNNDQVFGDLTIEAAKAAELTVSLDNTARVDGVLSLENLIIADQNAANQSAVRTLNVVSNGARNTSNEIGLIDALRVNTFNLQGTQDLKAYIDSASNYTAALPANRDSLTVDASELTGDLHLQINTDLVTTIDGTVDRLNTFTGTSGSNDVLQFTNFTDPSLLFTTTNTQISGFETLVFGDSNFGTLGGGVYGSFNNASTTGVQNYFVDHLHGNQYRPGVAGVTDADAGLELINLGDKANVSVFTRDSYGNAPDAALTLRSSGVQSELNVDLTHTSFDGISGKTYGVGDWGVAGELALEVGGYRTINLDLDSGNNTVGNSLNYNFDLVLLDRNGLNINEANFVQTGDVGANWATQGVAARELVLTGGNAAARNGDVATSDSVVLADLDAALDVIDLSGYAGRVTGNIDAAYQTGVSDVKVVVGSFDINWTVNTDLAVGQGYNTVFEFTSTGAGFTNDPLSAAATWTINDFVAVADAGVHGFAGTINSHSILDVSGLGITAYNQLRVTYDAVADETVIRSEAETLAGQGFSWEIKLAGGDYSQAGDLGIAENFIFA